MSESSSSSGGYGWVVGVMVFIVAMIVLMLVFVAFGANRTAPEPAVVSAASGGAVMPTPTNIATPPDTPTQIDQPVVLLPGRRVAAISPDGKGTRVYGDSRTDALVLDVYQDGAAFEIMAPGADVADYPVKSDGRTWYRVRASDGLVGWVSVDRLVPLEP